MTPKLLCHIIAFLDTQTWQRKSNVQTSEQDSEDENIDDNAEFRIAVETLAVCFAILALHVEEVVRYARKYLHISKVCYESVWYIVHTCPDIVLVSPLTTTHVERMFSSLKLIKTDRRSSMSKNTLSDLMEVYHEGLFKSFTLASLFSCGGNDARPTAVLIKVSESNTEQGKLES